MVWVLLTSACATVSQANFVEEVDPSTDQTSAEESLPSFFQEDVLRQWALDAEASTSYADPEWGAQQAVGIPDTSRCGDFQTAWAPAGSDSEEWLELKYALPVHATTINIVQSFNPNQVAKVELINNDGEAFMIYEQLPEAVDQPCPYALSIIVEHTVERYNTVRITLDQSFLGLGWNEIDAVELIGVVE